MEIPYNVEERQDTGMFNAKLGIWLFLASEVMLFGGLFSAYVFLRMGDVTGTFISGASELNIPLATFNTLVLISSSVTMIMSWVSLKLGEQKKFKTYLGTTLLLAGVFLVVKYFEYTAKFHHGIFPETSTFFAIYFTLTGLHMLHIIGGMVVIFYFLVPGSKMMNTESERFTNRIEIVGLYWHFVDLVWIFLFPVLYLL
ncbi:MAG: heme-copper oxidase subunit III [Candidatus Marinimicrobia bacterium]|jgi:heme/copper-type cytochrome/quinol oxidase subunit 3|nr:heme-copper oxidase subunit III [Candidatus Neomarinimicrobiota bacterium]MBT3947739.1 heme-copper oxidase subunit III [Candidatus Neomarinimicrobiota bacterium]MBT4063847.1 heme-copper oxidase subunit III [Candidatus Neomarinimicrobiota bacterium]MBT4307878.1 heme-copper oxidase subunit III [Candidatus Neomarinimicrobiota bacterium]MBT4452664.1 heme-copper oxidase subunit III [Candidatus Neomarinimicrobiota bacterium]|tara:strand:- start:6277 stop:6873 length:597 start_codon:yes stop_codon:yes gene_type:complete